MPLQLQPARPAAAEPCGRPRPGESVAAERAPGSVRGAHRGVVRSATAGPVAALLPCLDHRFRRAPTPSPAERCRRPSAPSREPRPPRRLTRPIRGNRVATPADRQSLPWITCCSRWWFRRAGWRLRVARQAEYALADDVVLDVRGAAAYCERARDEDLPGPVRAVRRAIRPDSVAVTAANSTSCARHFPTQLGDLLCMPHAQQLAHAPGCTWLGAGQLLECGPQGEQVNRVPRRYKFADLIQRRLRRRAGDLHELRHPAAERPRPRQRDALISQRCPGDLPSAVNLAYQAVVRHEDIVKEYLIEER